MVHNIQGSDNEPQWWEIMMKTGVPVQAHSMILMRRGDGCCSDERTIDAVQFQYSEDNG
jgi:hypothetical protein